MVQSFMERAFPPLLAMKDVSIKHLQLFEDRSDAACRVVVKTIGSHRWEARGVAWYAHEGGTNGRPLGAMRIAMKSPQMDDCRGGVFAVFAKIPPPIPSPAAHPIRCLPSPW